MTAGTEPIRERGVLTSSEEQWTRARSRWEIFEPLRSSRSVTEAQLALAAEKAGVRIRQARNILARARRGSGLVSDYLPLARTGGRGESRLPTAVEAIIDEVLHDTHRKRQRLSTAAAYRVLVERCAQAQLHPPAIGTYRAREKALSAFESAKARYGSNSRHSRRLTSAGGSAPERHQPLEQVQIDHTPMDVIAVSSETRKPIGRPTLTVAIDVYSRAIVGFVIGLDDPSSLVVGLCLASTVSDKRPLLEAHSLSDMSWPMGGVPKSLFTDNGKEFHSEALRRGVEQHGITLGFRPPGQPHWGGIIERLIGTLSTRSKELPGATFSNPVERDTYDSEGWAAMTLPELRRWMILQIIAYHETIHSSLGMSPRVRWEQGVERTGEPVRVADQTAFLIDFLPVFRRNVNRTGFQIQKLEYYADQLRPWIWDIDSKRKYILRRDPRDISRIWALDERSGLYLEIPLRNLSLPPISEAEYRAAAKEARLSGRAQVSTELIFRIAVESRETIDAAKRSTMKSRRAQERRPEPRSPSEARQLVVPPVSGAVEQEAPALPFEIRAGL